MMKVIKKTMLFQQIIFISIEGSPVDRVQLSPSNGVRLRVYDEKKICLTNAPYQFFISASSENSPLN